MTGEELELLDKRVTAAVGGGWVTWCCVCGAWIAFVDRIGKAVRDAA